MDRKQAIIIAAMVNAALLAVLFIVALTVREDPGSFAEMQLSSQQEMVALKPLFNEPIDAIAIANPLEDSTAQVLAEKSITHKLPPLSMEERPEISMPAIPNIAAAPTQFASPMEIAVEKGDSLEKIAKKFHTSVEAIIKLNHLPSSFLKVGQRLKIPADMVVAKEKTVLNLPSANEKVEYYTMKVGDNPWSIAMKHHMKLDELLKLNKLNEQSARKLKPGDRLRIR